MKIIFVCTGNTCRSPLAESYAKTIHSNKNFESRGIMVTSDEISRESLRIIESESLAQPTEPKQLNANDIEDSLLLTMTNGHKAHIEQMYPDANVKLLSEHTYGTLNDVMDPFGGNSHIYDEVFKELKDYIDRL
ncbi:low molecular weight phosphatase family protein [Aliicoccus persicus]|uniref:Low molecular weight protein-tyrosine-phosphatase PtpB n=1 Tax=Aliicoccus persicus TaxID=930138 RepID=A0A662Z457_9STAP|nr:low molecular weight phosphatase family protein [Aliicoccus persicus]SEW08255.1 protein-tyrosine phosphatase [Aliicoccus persicus]HJE20310.1 low molecular weight phosphatase family protein [Aliicoccus persicus]